MQRRREHRSVGNMADENDHATRVKAWRRSVGADHSAPASLRALERGFGAVWRRAHVTLGDVTLTAIGDRVLHDAAERYPFLNALRLDPTGISCEDLAHEAGSLDTRELDAAVELVVVELLTVLGRLTADVLTPTLHAELAADADRDDDEESAP